MTPNRQYKSEPRLFLGAEGMHYITGDGRRILEGMAELWRVNAGHGQMRIIEAMKQMSKWRPELRRRGRAERMFVELAARASSCWPILMTRRKTTSQAASKSLPANAAVDTSIRSP